MSAACVDEASVWAALADVRDPEIPVGIVDLGLVQQVRLDSSEVAVDLTLTSMGCPCLDWIVADVQECLQRLAGDRTVTVNVVWDPPWTRERISDAGRKALADIGVST